MIRFCMFLVVVVLAWVGLQFGYAAYENQKVREIMMMAAAQHRHDSGDSNIVDDIVTKVTALGPFTIKSKDIDISRESDKDGAIIKVSYTKTIKIPLTNKKWILHFAPVIEDKEVF